MASCERCGNEMPDNAAICPECGTITSTARSATPPTNYNPQLEDYQASQQPGGYGQGYQQQPFGSSPPPQSGYIPQQPPGYAPQQQGFVPQQQMFAPQQNYGYAPPVYNAPVNVTVVNTVSNKNTAALITEVILSLFGVYGVGWLMGGETTVGVILLICSFVLVWPISIVFIVFTLGLGLLCIGPLLIAAIIINAILLNKLLDRKAAKMPPVIIHTR